MVTVVDLATARRLLEVRGPAAEMAQAAFDPTSGHVAIGFPSGNSVGIYALERRERKRE
jgi:hypothetical protein